MFLLSINTAVPKVCSTVINEPQLLIVIVVLFKLTVYIVVYVITNDHS